MNLMPPPNIEFSIVIDRDAVVMPKIVNMLNKIAESRYDGTNAKLVNDMQPELDFDQDKTLLHDSYEDAIERIASQVEPYIKSLGLFINPDTEEQVAGKYNFGMSFPHNWKSRMIEPLRKKYETYIVYRIIAEWFEKLSINDVEYNMRKADELLFEIKRICELRQGKVHVAWNSTYL